MRRMLLAVIASLFLIPVTALADSIPNRVTQPVTDAQTVTLKNQVHPLATAQNDRGVAPADLSMGRMRLVLKRSEQQQAELKQLLLDLQTPGSPNYHKWLTPEQFGRRFGPSDSDLQAVTGWLQSHGFKGIHITQGRTLVEFSGTVALVEQALHTSIHRYEVNGKSHWANATAPQIPTALSPVVAGIASLNDFFSLPLHVRRSEQRVSAIYKAGLSPQITFGNGMTALTPGDLAVIYNSKPLAQSGVDGTGRTIAVIGRSNINVQDINDFRRVFGLPDNPVQVIINGNDPGNLGEGEELEALLDNQYAGSLAPNATIKFVVSASTFFADGVDLSQIYAIDNNVADVMTESFGRCEQNFTQVRAEEKRLLAEQAAAQGITFMVSTGDSGSADCAPAGYNATNLMNDMVGVNMLASPPDFVGVGGTQFNENGNPSAYWGENDPTTRASVLSYIPEEAWNESVAGEGGTGFLYAGGGGSSIFFPKPSWQSGVPGIPETGARHLPDISLAAAGMHDFYLVCMQSSCQPDENGYISFYPVGGTSAGAPTFASIMALVDQSTNSRQGNANHVLYRIAATQDYSQCNGSDLVGKPASTCVFQDITVGSNAVPGLTGYGTPEGKYPAGFGYDLATGLGSVNVANLVEAWKNLPMSPTTTSLVVTPTDTVHGTSAIVSITVNSDAGIPAGPVVLLRDGGPTIGTFSLDETGAASGSVYLPGGTYQVTARYGGDGFYSASVSEPVTVSVTPEDTNLSLKSYVWNEIEWRWDPSPSASFGQTAGIFVTATGASGNGEIPSGNVRFMFDGSEVYAGPLDSDGTLGIQFDVMPPFGEINVTAEYAGDNSYKPANASLVFTLEPAITTIAVESSRNIIHVGGEVTLTAAVKTSVDTMASGTVTFYSGGSQLGAPVDLMGEKGSLSTSVSITTNQLAEGQNVITAVYSGNEELKPSTSAPVTVTVTSQIPTTTSVTASASSVAQNAPVTFTAEVRKEFTGGSALSGTVQFAVDNVPAGPPVALSGTGIAAYSVSSLSVGQHAITATYSGSTDYVTSSGTVSINVTAPAGFSVSAASGTISVSKGGSGVGTINLSATNGFIGSVALTCAVAPAKVDGPTCSLTPASVNMDTANTTAQSTVTIVTTAPRTLASLGTRSGGGLWASGLFGLFGMVLLGSSPRRHRIRALILFTTLVLLVAMVGCGGGSSSSSAPVDSGTPAGTYTVTVTASNSGLPPQTSTITLNVQ